jgi:hypothetical protein
MAAPERFAEASDSFPLHRGRRPYMAQRAHSLRCLGLDAVGGEADIAWASRPNPSGAIDP